MKNKPLFALFPALVVAGSLGWTAQAAPDAAENKPKPKPKAGDQAETDPEVRMVKKTWLGVATQPLNPALREHLELPEGFGIEVDYVAEGSPADHSGIKPHDIFVRLDDQRLISPEHLAILVHSQKKSAKIKLAIVRKGAEQTVEVTLGETDAPAQPEWPRAFGFQAQPMPGQPHQWQFQGQFPMPQFDGKEGDEWQKSMREYQDRMKEWMEKNQPHRFHNRPGPPPPPAKSEKEEGGAAVAPALPLPNKWRTTEPPKDAPKVGPGKPPAISVRPGFPVQVIGGSGLIRIDNQEGEVTIQVQDGKHTISIVNADGEKVYQGDYDPEKGADALPKEAREQLKKMKLDDLKVLGLPDAKAGSSKSSIKIEINEGAPAEAEEKAEKAEKGKPL
jgi:hypothetical protein